MAEERENQKSNQVGRSDEADFQGHGQVPLTEDSDPDELKTKLANDEDDDVEAHSQHPHQTGG
jgi:hypothetical protein